MNYRCCSKQLHLSEGPLISNRIQKPGLWPEAEKTSRLQADRRAGSAYARRDRHACRPAVWRWEGIFVNMEPLFLWLVGELSCLPAFLCIRCLRLPLPVKGADILTRRLQHFQEPWVSFCLTRKPCCIGPVRK